LAPQQQQRLLGLGHRLLGLRQGPQQRRQQLRLDLGPSLWRQLRLQAQWQQAQRQQGHLQWPSRPRRQARRLLVQQQQQQAAQVRQVERQVVLLGP